MSYGTADEPMLSRLRTVVEAIEVRDPAGTVLGHYIPASPEAKAQHELVRSLFDLEGVKRIAATETQGFTIEEVMQHLQALDQHG